VIQRRTEKEEGSVDVDGSGGGSERMVWVEVNARVSVLLTACTYRGYCHVLYTIVDVTCAKHKSKTRHTLTTVSFDDVNCVTCVRAALP
jgi:hypothetical protein